MSTAVGSSASGVCALRLQLSPWWHHPCVRPLRCPLHSNRGRRMLYSNRGRRMLYSNSGRMHVQAKECCERKARRGRVLFDTSAVDCSTSSGVKVGLLVLARLFLPSTGTNSTGSGGGALYRDCPHASKKNKTHNKKLRKKNIAKFITDQHKLLCRACMLYKSLSVKTTTAWTSTYCMHGVMLSMCTLSALQMFFPLNYCT